MSKLDALVTPDLAAILIDEYHRIFDYLDSFPKSAKPDNTDILLDRAHQIMIEVSHAGATSARGAEACVYMAKCLCEEAMDLFEADGDRAGDLLQAADRCMTSVSQWIGSGAGANNSAYAA